MYFLPLYICFGKQLQWILGFIINKNTEKIHENSNSKIMFGGPVDSESLYILDFIDDDLNKFGLTSPLTTSKIK